MLELYHVALLDGWGKKFFRCSVCTGAFASRAHRCDLRARRRLLADVVTCIYTTCRRCLSEHGVNSRARLHQLRENRAACVVILRACCQAVQSAVGNLPAAPTASVGAGRTALQFQCSAAKFSINIAVGCVLGVAQPPPDKQRLYALFLPGAGSCCCLFTYRYMHAMHACPRLLAPKFMPSPVAHLMHV